MDTKSYGQGTALKLSVSISHCLELRSKRAFLIHFTSPHFSCGELSRYISSLSEKEKTVFRFLVSQPWDQEVLCAMEWLGDGQQDRGIVFYGEVGWPAAWAEETSQTLFFFFCGRFPDMAQPYVQVTGTRRATLAALRAAYAFGLEMGYAGAGLVTGLSAGIEQAVAEGAVEAGGTVLAFLPGGLDDDYPYCSRLRRLISGEADNTSIADRRAKRRRGKTETPVIQVKGTIISCDLPHYHARAWSFSRRSQLSGTHAAITVAVQYPLRSGVKYTVEAALDFGRDVYVHAVGTEGLPESSGTRKLVEEGAVIISSYADVAQKANVRLPQPRVGVMAHPMKPVDTHPVFHNVNTVHCRFGTWYTIKEINEGRTGDESPGM